MILLDPFYGVFREGKIIAKWLNRLLLLAESASVVHASAMLVRADLLESWMWLLIIPGMFLSIHITNLVIRGVWNIVVVFVYGTTDADTILQQRREKAARRAAHGRRTSGYYTEDAAGLDITPDSRDGGYFE